MGVNLTALTVYDRSDRGRFYLPNGVAVLQNGNIAIADGGNNRICLVDINGQPYQSIGEKGLGKYCLKEPVGVFVSPANEIYVTDWHNHRVVIYDRNLNYIEEFGHYGSVSSPVSWRNIFHRTVRFLRNLAYTGSYMPVHFDYDDNQEKCRINYSVSLLLDGLLYYFRRNGLAGTLKMIATSEDVFNKPNGVAFYQNKIVVSQRNSKCISLYRKDSALNIWVPISNYFGPSNNVRFGRLGNVTFDSQGHLYICDERSHVIWRLDPDFDLADRITGQDSGTGDFLPFSCCLINQNLLCVCGGLNFQIINLQNKDIVYCSDNIGELHGVAYDGTLKRLYIADRSHSLIRVFQITHVDES